MPSAVREFKPGVVLLDLAMPDRSGFDVAEQLSRECGSACPVLVALSAHYTADTKAKVDISGFHHFIPKPYEPTNLLACVAELDKK